MESIAMKKNTIVLGCILCAFTLFSCQKEENNPIETTPKEIIPTGTVEEDVPAGYSQLTLSAVSDDTKTTLDGTTVKWKTEDQIKVYCSDGTASDFTLVGEGGSATGSFAGLVPSGKTALYAIYPNDLYSSVSEATVHVTIPATQDGVFGNANIAVAKIDAETLDMAFKNVNAFIGFTLRPVSPRWLSQVSETAEICPGHWRLTVRERPRWPGACQTVAPASRLPSRRARAAHTMWPWPPASPTRKACCSSGTRGAPFQEPIG